MRASTLKFTIVCAALFTSSLSHGGIDVQPEMAIKLGDSKEKALTLATHLKSQSGPVRFGVGPYYTNTMYSVEKDFDTLYLHELGIDAFVGYHFTQMTVFSRARVSLYSGGEVKYKHTEGALEVEGDANVERTRRAIGLGVMVPVNKGLNVIVAGDLARGEASGDFTYTAKNPDLALVSGKKEFPAKEETTRSLSVGISYDIK